MQEEQVSVLRVVVVFVAKVFLIVIALLLVAALTIKMAGLGPSFLRGEIRDWRDLADITYNLGGSYLLMNDLDSSAAGYEELASLRANGGRGWQPIGTTMPSDCESFTGIFDGQGYEIRDLFIHRSDTSPVGLFCEVGQGGVIKHVGVVNAVVTGNSHVGGLVGVNLGAVSNSYSSGSVTGNYYVGGLVGDNSGRGKVSDSYSSGSVTGNWGVGGLVGYNSNGTISGCHATGKVTGNWLAGGLVGSNYEGSVSCSFWDTDTSGQVTSAGVGTGKTTTEMRDIGTFLGAGWNITAAAPNQTDPAYIWNIVNGLTYPFLSWQS